MELSGMRLLILSTLLSFVFGQSDENQIDFEFEVLETTDEYLGGAMNLEYNLKSDSVEESEEGQNPDIKLTIIELIKKYGFPVEVHNVFTEDDYVLTIHRIPYGRHKNSSSSNSSQHQNLDKDNKRPAVFLHHGYCSSAVDWIMNTADKALPYMLADSGYDVWLGNARGNGYSKRHITMTQKRSKYWDFSWHEIGKYDVPAVIDYILKVTGQEDLNYIGHSMGTTVFFVAMSLRPEYNAKIRKMVALGPAVFMEDMKSPVRYLAPFSTAEKFIYDLFGNGMLLPAALIQYMHKVAPYACQEGSFSGKICENMIYLVGGLNLEQINETQLPVALAHTPSSASTKAGVHYLQSVSSEKFRQYDYGLIGNIRRYSQTTPPNYNLKKVTAPVALFWAQADSLCDPKGVKRLADELPNLLGSFRVNNTKFTHIDFIFAKDADTILYKDILNILKS